MSDQFDILMAMENREQIDIETLHEIFKDPHYITLNGRQIFITEYNIEHNLTETFCSIRFVVPKKIEINNLPKYKKS